jgi:hypothetical protein
MTKPLDFEGVPQAHHIGFGTCGECPMPHVILFDERDRPIAQFIPPNGFIGALQDATYSIIAQREDGS